MPGPVDEQLINAAGAASTPRPDLDRFAADVHSQHGEDGILAQVLARIGRSHDLDRWCVDVGAWDGRHLSNTAGLIESCGYRAVMVEPRPDRHSELAVNYPGDNVLAVRARVGLGPDDGLDAILASSSVPRGFDVLSVDVDGIDFHIWQRLRRYRPKVVCIEYNPTIPNEVEFVQAPDPRIQQGSSAASLVALAASKGYKPVAATATNLILVADEVAEAVVGAEVPTLAELRDDTDIRCFMFVGFDGTLHTSREVVLPWHGGRQVPLRRLQALPRILRRYPGGVGRLRRAAMVGYLMVRDPRRGRSRRNGSVWEMAADTDRPSVN